MSTSASPPPGNPEGRSGSNRRLHERIPINSHVVVCWEDGKGGRRRLQARAVNVSPSGVLLEVQDHVAVGTAVILQTSNFVVLGKACVRHCEPKGLWYTLGFYVPGRLPRTF